MCGWLLNLAAYSRGRFARSRDQPDFAGSRGGADDRYCLTCPVGSLASGSHGRLVGGPSRASRAPLQAVCKDSARSGRLMVAYRPSSIRVRAGTAVGRWWWPVAAGRSDVARPGHGRHPRQASVDIFIIATQIRSIGMMHSPRNPPAISPGTAMPFSFADNPHQALPPRVYLSVMTPAAKTSGAKMIPATIPPAEPPEIPLPRIATPSRQDRTPKARMNLCRFSAAKVVTDPSAVWVSATGTSPGSQPQFAHGGLARVPAQFGHGRDDGDFAGCRVSVVAMVFLLFRFRYSDGCTGNVRLGNRSEEHTSELQS